LQLGGLDTVQLNWQVRQRFCVVSLLTPAAESEIVSINRLTDDFGGDTWAWMSFAMGCMRVAPPFRVSVGFRIQELECAEGLHGYHSSTFVTDESGTAYAFGLNWAGILGLGEQDTNLFVPSPRKIISLIGQRIVRISASFTTHNSHAMAVTEAGGVFSWGAGSAGQLGHGDLDNRSEPRLVNYLQQIPVEDVCCLQLVSFIVGKDGALRMCGTPSSNDKPEKYPIDFPGFGEKCGRAAKRISSSLDGQQNDQRRIFVVDNYGVVHGFGKFGSYYYDSPRPIEAFSPATLSSIVKVTCGYAFLPRLPLIFVSLPVFQGHG
jgi:Regulator of chromosome condensation (RCC1) repeat